MSRSNCLQNRCLVQSLFLNHSMLSHKGRRVQIDYIFPPIGLMLYFHVVGAWGGSQITAIPWLLIFTTDCRHFIALFPNHLLLYQCDIWRNYGTHLKLPGAISMVKLIGQTSGSSSRSKVKVIRLSFTMGHRHLTHCYDQLVTLNHVNLYNHWCYFHGQRLKVKVVGQRSSPRSSRL